MALTLSPEVRAVIESGRLAHFTTIAKDGRPHTTVVWVGLDGNEIVIGKLMHDQKVANIEQDPRVTFSMEADGEQFGISSTSSSRARGDHCRWRPGCPCGPAVVGPGRSSANARPAGRGRDPSPPTKVRGMGPWASQ